MNNFESGIRYSLGFSYFSDYLIHFLSRWQFHEFADLLLKKIIPLQGEICFYLHQQKVNLLLRKLLPPRIRYRNHIASQILPFPIVFQTYHQLVDFHYTPVHLLLGELSQKMSYY